MRKKLLFLIVFIIFVCSSQCFANSETNYSSKEYIDSSSIIMDLFFTIVAFELIPFILKVFKRRVYNAKDAKRIAIINSMIVQVIIVIIQIVPELYIEDYKATFNFFPAFLYGVINYYWLKSKVKNNKNITDNNINQSQIIHRNEEKESNLIEKSEDKIDDKNDLNSTDLGNKQKEEKELEDVEVNEKSNYCTKCGKKIKREWSFCNYCGKKVE